MIRRSAARAARAAVFGAAASTVTATILLMISICFALPVRAVLQDGGAVTNLVS